MLADDFHKVKVVKDLLQWKVCDVGNFHKIKVRAEESLRVKKGFASKIFAEEKFVKFASEKFAMFEDYHKD